MSEHVKSSVPVAVPAGALESGAGPSTSATTQLAQAVPGGWLLSDAGVPVLDWNGQLVRLEPGQPAVTRGGPIPDGLRAHLQAQADMYGQIDAYPDAGDLVLLYRAAAPVTSEAVPYFTPQAAMVRLSGAGDALGGEENEDTGTTSIVVERILPAGATGWDTELAVDFTITLGTLGTLEADDLDAGQTYSGTVTFAAGAATATIDVSVIDDTIIEDDEDLTITLSNPSYRQCHHACRYRHRRCREPVHRVKQGRRRLGNRRRLV